MPIGNYGFDYGTVASIHPHSIAIALDTEKKTVQTQVAHSYNDRLKRFLRPGSEVICSWRHRDHTRRDAPAIIHPMAVEGVNQWRRPSSYRNLYSHSRGTSPGINAEYWFKDMLLAAGVRADHSTGFADEHLGVDLWVFLLYMGTWRWIPVDVTFEKLKKLNGTPTSKFSTAIARGVFPLRLTPSYPPRNPKEALSMLVTQIQTVQHLFSGNKKHPVHRQKAHIRELQEYPIGTRKAA